MDIELLKNFCIIAEFLSITKTAEHRCLSQSAVSKKLSLLEQNLGNVPLFHRHPSGLQLTEEGASFLPAVQSVINELTNILGDLKTPQQAKSGELKLHTMHMIGMEWLIKKVPTFCQQYPDIDLALRFDNLKSFSTLGFPSGVSAGLATFVPSHHSTYIWKKLATYKQYIYAHPAYLARCGEPEGYGDLDRHQLVRIQSSSDVQNDVPDHQLNAIQYLGSQGPQVPRPAMITVDSIAALQQLVLSGAAIGILPEYLPGTMKLKKILTHVYDPVQENQVYPVYLVYPSYLKKYERIRMLRQFLEEQIAQTEGLNPLVSTNGHELSAEKHVRFSI